MGVSVLTAARLEKVDIYDYDKKRIRQDVLDNSLNQLRGRYSEGFVDALRVLLNPDENQRPDFVELNEEIKGYRHDTRSKAVRFFSIFQCIYMNLELGKNLGNQET